MAGVVASIAAPFVANTVGQIAQNILGNAGQGGGGLFGPLVNSFTSAFGPLLGQAANPFNLISQLPQMFSPFGMSPQAFNDPLSILRQCGTPNFACGTTGGFGGSGGFGGVNSGPSAGAGLNQLQADVEAAKQNFLNNPKDVEAMIAYQEAQQQFQLAVKLVSEELAMFASIQNSIIQKTRVQ